jgi:hypothetical protein
MDQKTQSEGEQIGAKNSVLQIGASGAAAEDCGVFAN